MEEFSFILHTLWNIIKQTVTARVINLSIQNMLYTYFQLHKPNSTLISLLVSTVRTKGANMPYPIDSLRNHKWEAQLQCTTKRKTRLTHQCTPKDSY